MSFQRSEAKKLPKQIDPKLLHANGKLLSEDHIMLLGLDEPELEEGHYKGKFRTKITATHDGKIYVHSVILGTGGTSKVKLAQELKSGDFYALKILKPKKKEKIGAYKAVATNELAILKALGRAKSNLITWISDKTNLPKYLFIMEIAKGEELYYLIKNDKLPHDSIELLTISFNIANAMKMFFDLGYLHRDIKPENIFIDITTGEVSLIDFGYAIQMDKEHRAYSEQLCTLAHLAPEILNKTSCYYRYYSEATEAYAFGTVLQAILFGTMRYTDRHDPSQSLKTYSLKKLRLVNNAYSVKCENSDSYEIDASIVELTKQLLMDDPTQRPTLQDTCHILKNFLPKVETQTPCVIHAVETKQAVPASTTSCVSKQGFFPQAPSPYISLLNLLNLAHPCTWENKKNSDGSLKQYLQFSEKKYEAALKKLRSPESNLREGIDFRISGNKFTLEIMGKIKLHHGRVVIEDAEAVMEHKRYS